MARAFYAEAADALRGFLPQALRSFSHYHTARNLKVWYGESTKEHYEVQTVSDRAIGGRGRRAVLEIGFHAEHPEAERNERALALLAARERTWRRRLGPGPEAGRFLGRPSPWRRLSEVWDGEEVWQPEAAIEAAERLAAYIRAFEPIRAPAGTKRPMRARAPR